MHLIFRLFLWHHHRSAGLSTDGHICLLRRHHFQYPCFCMRIFFRIKTRFTEAVDWILDHISLRHALWSGFGMSGADGSNKLWCAGNQLLQHTNEEVTLLAKCTETQNMLCYSVSFSSVWIRGFAHVDSCRISGFVSGPVVYHCSTVPVPLGSNLRGLSSCLLRHLPSHRATHRVRRDPDCVDLTLRPVWNEGHPPIMHHDTLEQKLHWTQTKPSTHSPDTSLFIKESTVLLPAIQSQAISGLCHQAGKLMTSYRFLLRESWNWSHCALSQLFVHALDLRWYLNDSRGKTRIVEICTL